MSDTNESPEAARKRGRFLAKTFIDRIYAKRGVGRHIEALTQDGTDGPLATQGTRYIVNVPVPLAQPGTEVQIRLTFRVDGDDGVRLAGASRWWRRIETQ